MKRKTWFLFELWMLSMLLMFMHTAVQSQNYLTSDSAVAESIRNSFKNKETQFTVYFRLDHKPTADYFWDKACAHTGVPEEGGYLCYNISGHGCPTSSVSGSGGIYSGYFTYHISYMQKAAQEQEVTKALNAAADDIRKTAGTEFEKARAAYDFVTKFESETNYQDSLFQSYPSEFSTYAALIQRKASSRGLSTELYRLLLMLGVDNRIVESGNHVWNIIYIGGKWYHADADAGFTGYRGGWALEERNKPYYFFLKGSNTWSEISNYSYTGSTISASDYPLPFAAAVTIKNANGTVVSGKSLTTTAATYQLNASASPASALQRFRWKCTSDSYDAAAVDSNGKVTFKKAATVTITAAALDGSGVSASVKITYDPLRGFVTRCYKMILGRSPEKSGLDYWKDLLQTGKRTGAEMVANFISSPEFQNKKYPNSKVAEILYKTMLDRKPEANGLAYWTGLLNDGVSHRYIIRGFAGSAEFKKICSTYGIQPGTLTLTENRDKNLKVTQFVSRNYSIALGRQGDADGLNFWTGKILTKALTPQQVADSFVFSKECVNKKLNNTDFVKMLYKLYMGREFDQAGLDYWLKQMKNGMARQTVAKSFGGSKEFRNIVASYGL